MKAEYLERAVTEDTTGVLGPVVDAAYALKPLPKLEILTIAHQTNKSLGYPLFDDLYYPRLVLDFSTVARAVQINMMKSR